jgi:FdhD protein
MNEYMSQIVSPIPGRFGIKATSAVRMAAEGISEAECQVIHEDVLTIEIEDVGAYSLMWTPTEDNSQSVGYTLEDGVLADAGVPEALALGAGFVFTEGIVNRLDDIAYMSVCPERPDVVRMRLLNPAGVAVRRRNVVMNSSCGVCGGREQIQNGIAVTVPVGDTLRMSLADFEPLRNTMHLHQDIFGSTGGAHGAVVFDASLKSVAVAEDLGRHNALDKVIGYRFLSGKGFAGCGVFITSRISYEMVAKSARANFEVVAAISAPSSLAIEMADRFGITLCGFVRDESVKVYTHSHRITQHTAGTNRSEPVGNLTQIVKTTGIDYESIRY